MHTSKRNPEERAYKHGYFEGLKHHSDVNCPYSLKKRAQWLAGYRQGRRDRSSSIIPAITVH